MTSLFLLLPISLLLVVLIGVAFWWAIFSGQFDNTQQAAESILLDDDSSLNDDRDARVVDPLSGNDPPSPHGNAKT